VAPGTSPAAQRSRWWWLLPASIATVVTALAVGAAAWALRPAAVAAHLVKFSFTLPEGHGFGSPGRAIFTVSPDGTKLVYAANQRLYLRMLGELEAHAIPGTEADGNAFNPVFAPDGQSIAFWSATGPLNGALKRIPITGGSASILANTGNP